MKNDFWILKVILIIALTIYGMSLLVFFFYFININLTGVQQSPENFILMGEIKNEI